MGPKWHPRPRATWRTAVERRARLIYAPGGFVVFPRRGDNQRSREGRRFFHGGWGDNQRTRSLDEREYTPQARYWVSPEKRDLVDDCTQSTHRAADEIRARHDAYPPPSFRHHTHLHTALPPRTARWVCSLACRSHDHRASSTSWPGGLRLLLAARQSSRTSTQPISARPRTARVRTATQHSGRASH